MAPILISSLFTTGPINTNIVHRLVVVGDRLKLRIIDIFLFNPQYLCGIYFLFLSYIR